MEKIRESLLEAMALKALPRAGWLRVGVQEPESVAAHSWGVAWLVLVLCPPQLDRLRALEIAVLHDLPEVYAGDITPYDNVTRSEKHRIERESLSKLVEFLPTRHMVTARWEEYEDGTSPESRFVKACDKLDMALQAAVYAEQDVDTREFIESALKSLADSELCDLLVLD